MVQSAVFLPESETAGISPGRGLGSSIRSSPLSSKLRRTLEHRLSSLQVPHYTRGSQIVASRLPGHKVRRYRTLG